MSRGYIIVEGPTEETFVRQTLAPYLGRFGVYVLPCCLETGRRKRRYGGKESLQIFRGGTGRHYRKIKKDIQLWMSRGNNDFISTMFDLYGLPEDFPSLIESRKISDPYERVDFLEIKFKEDIGHGKFIPYLQLHEFEALLFSNPSKFTKYFIGEAQEITKIEEIKSRYNSPEHINDGFETAPSKQIINLFPEYNSAKTVAGPMIAEAIGIEEMRKHCKHFNQWVEKLQHLGN